jgi:hypothetical protein
VKGGHKQPDKAGRKNVVAAAAYAVKGDLNEARKRMALAYEPSNPKVKPTLEAPGATPALSGDAKATPRRSSRAASPATSPTTGCGTTRSTR